LFDVPHASRDFPAVRLQLGFTGASRANAAAKLRHFNAVSCQARHHVVQLRQLDLQLAFPGSRVPRKDVEDELRAIDHPPLDNLFDVALLGWTEVVIEQEHVGIDGSGSARNFLEFAGAYQSCRIGAIAPLQDFANDSCPRAFGKGAQFGEGFFGVELRDTGPAIGFRRRAGASNGIPRRCRLRRHRAFGGTSTARPRIQSDQERTLAIAIFSCRDGA
jgi:hypothetical protein